MLTEIRNNELVTNNSNLFDDFIAYLDISKKSVITYKRALYVFRRYLLSNNLHIDSVNRQNILDFKEYLKEKKLKNTTISLYLIAIKRLFSYVESKGGLNVAKGIKSLKIAREHKKDPLELMQVKTLLQSIDTSSLDGKRNYAMIYLAITTGLRTIEIQRADVEDIKVLSGQNVLFIQGKGKTDKADYAKLAHRTYQAIDAYLKAINASVGEPLFVSCSNKSKGVRLNVESISHLIKRILRQAGFDSDRLTAHSLRHTTATTNLTQGGSLAETQQLLRHNNINTTMIYNHAIEKMKNCSEARIEDAIDGVV